jgi:hypothetical protein
MRHAGAVAAGHGSRRGLAGLLDKLVDAVLGGGLVRRFVSPVVSPWGLVCCCWDSAHLLASARIALRMMQHV